MSLPKIPLVTIAAVPLEQSTTAPAVFSLNLQCALRVHTSMATTASARTHPGAKKVLSTMAGTALVLPPVALLEAGSMVTPASLRLDLDVILVSGMTRVFAFPSLIPVALLDLLSRIAFALQVPHPDAPHL